MRMTILFGLTGLVLAAIALAFWLQLRRMRRAEFIRACDWPPRLPAKMPKRRHLTRQDSALVAEGLRQFFLAYHYSGRRYVAMPSKIADDLWHEFILYTRAYDDFCKKAFGGFLHHTPAVALSPIRLQSNEGLRRVWYWCCRDEHINVANPTRLPLLFALDKKLGIVGGYIYEPNCAQLRQNGAAGTQCGGDFSSSSIDGSTSGIGGGAGSPERSSGSGSGGRHGGGGTGGSGGGGRGRRHSVLISR